MEIDKIVDPNTLLYDRRKQLPHCVAKMTVYKDDATIFFNQVIFDYNMAFRAGMIRCLMAMARDFSNNGLLSEARWLMKDARENPSEYDDF